MAVETYEVEKQGPAIPDVDPERKTLIDTLGLDGQIALTSAAPEDQRPLPPYRILLKRERVMMQALYSPSGEVLAKRWRGGVFPLRVLQILALERERKMFHDITVRSNTSSTEWILVGKWYGRATPDARYDDYHDVLMARWNDAEVLAPLAQLQKAAIQQAKNRMIVSLKRVIDQATQALAEWQSSAIELPDDDLSVSFSCTKPGN